MLTSGAQIDDFRYVSKNWRILRRFGAEKPRKTYIALAHGRPEEPRFEINAKLAPHPVKLGQMRIDPKGGKRAHTAFEVAESFAGFTLLHCWPSTGRTHQIRIHVRHAHLPLVGDALYGGRPLLLSQLKPDYQLAAGKTERPLLATTALHAEQLELPHPVTQETVRISAPWPKDLTVAIKYLRRYAPAA